MAGMGRIRGGAIAAIGTATAVVIAGGVAFAGPGSNATGASASVAPAASTSSPVPAAPAAPGADREGALTRALDGLVADKTLTRAQADKVLAAVGTERAAGREDRRDDRFDRRAEVESVITSTLGITADELRTQLRSGKTLGEIAGDKKDALRTALVKAATAEIDARVKDGSLSADRATAMKARVGERVDRMLDRKMPGGGRGMGGMRGHGWGGGSGDDQDGTTPASPAAPTTAS